MKYKQLQDTKIPAIVLGIWSWKTGLVGGNTVFGNPLQESDLRPVCDKAIKKSFLFIF